MANMPTALVTGAPRTPLPYGLFSVVPFREGSSDRWESGIKFESIGCPTPIKGVGPIDPEEPNEIPGLPKDLDEGGFDLGTAGTFLIYESYVCTPIGNSMERAEDGARARLEAREEQQVERAFAAANFANGDPAEVLPSVGSIKLAIAELEQALAEGYGAQGILHMSRFTATLALEAGVVEASNNRLRTKLGTPVIAGSGYEFEGVLASPAMFGYRSEVITSSNRLGDLLDMDNNDLYGIAERNYLVAVDPCGFWYIDYLPEAEPGQGQGHGHGSDPEPEPEPEPEPDPEP